MIAHGEFKYYYRSGKLESIGEFREGGKYGIWQRFDEDGTEKPEKIYASQPMLKALAKEKADRKGK
jgi:antitoxin component YwqK of YwqJK toxin-antitoxin module